VLEYVAGSSCEGAHIAAALYLQHLEMPQESMTPQQLFLILRARWRLAASIWGAIVLTVLGINLLLPKQYVANASVLVDVKPDPVAPTVGAGEAPEAYMATQVDIITSPRVARRVVKQLHLDQDPAFRQRWQEATDGRGHFDGWITGLLKRALAVSPSGVGNVINISVTWNDPATAAALANAFAQSYIATTIELKVDPARQYANSFSERADELRADLEAKQKALSDFESRNGIVATDERMDVENSRLAEISTQLVAIQGQRQDSQSRQRPSAGDADSIPEVMQNPVIQGLKAELSRAQVKLDDIATRLGVNHPEYISALSEVQSLKQRVASERDQIIGSMNEAMRVNMRREAEVAASLQAQKQRILELKHQHDQAQVLQNDVLTAQRNLDAVTQRLAQSSLEGATTQTNLALLTPATEPSIPSGPKVLLNCMLAALAGAGLGIGAALLMEKADQRIRSDADLAMALGIPLLGRVSAASTDSAREQRARRALPHLKPSAS
jgi:chain length determinant protein EpsF